MNKDIDNIPLSSLTDSNQKKITKWKNEPTIDDLKQVLTSVSGVQSAHIAKIKDWNDLRDTTGKYARKSPKGRSSVVVKLVRKQAEWRYSALTEPFHSSDKLFQVTPITFEDEQASVQNELLLNWQFRTKMNRIKFIDDLVRSTVDDGTAIAKVGWFQSTKMVKEEVPTWEYYLLDEENEEDFEHLEMFGAWYEIMHSNPRQYNESCPENIKEAINYYEDTEIPVLAFQNGTEVVEVEEVLENYPTVEVLEPGNVYIDPYCYGDIDKALFVINSYEVSYKDLYSRKDIFHNLNKLDWDENNLGTSFNHESNGLDYVPQFKANKKVIAYDYWGYHDIRGDGEMVPILATWVGETIIRMVENPFPDGKPPFVLVNYMPVKRSLYGEPDAELLKDNQLITSAVMRGIIDTLGKSANGQTGIPKGLLDNTNKIRFFSDQDYEYNAQEGLNPRDFLVQHTMPNISESAIGMISMQSNEAESLTGVKNFVGGISGEAYGKVVEGMRSALDAASKREMAILRRIADGVKRIGAKIVAMNSEYLSKDEVIRVTNREYVSISMEDIKGNFDLEVDIATAEIDNAKSQDLGFILQTYGPIADPAITHKILAKMCDLKRLPDLAEELRTYKQEPSPEEVRMMEIEMELKEMELQKLQSEIALNMARAKKEASESDLKDLDFLEQETGTKHEREMAKQKAQSDGNINLEVAKAILGSNGSNKEGNTAKAESKKNSSDLENDPVSAISRLQQSRSNPELSRSSSKYDPKKDPSTNLALQRM